MNFFIFFHRSLTVVCCPAFASKYHISSWNPYSLCTRIDARVFFFSCQHRTGIDFFVANMENIVHSMQVLNMFSSCTDTMGPFIIPFITCSYKIVKRCWLEIEYSHKDQFMPIFVAIGLVWIAMNQTIGTNVKKSCLIIVKVMCRVIGT